ncbi:hypothetical protein CHS0354_018573 [Potamilus streckersoni]|uniref:DksA C4-type domain-containing protein n=1 Tax=Potamilus streckersoni TaxID=2493646 RepID=A0AAE0WB10_9BIVA|nr:hypothetical protein CHS0354_018573 [Potamilus streckersoni]
MLLRLFTPHSLKRQKILRIFFVYLCVGGWAVNFFGTRLLIAQELYVAYPIYNEEESRRAVRRQRTVQYYRHGDTITTRFDEKLTVMFINGNLIRLMPNTSVRIKYYREYNNIRREFEAQYVLEKGHAIFMMAPNNLLGSIETPNIRITNIQNLLIAVSRSGELTSVTVTLGQPVISNRIYQKQIYPGQHIKDIGYTLNFENDIQISQKLIQTKSDHRVIDLSDDTFLSTGFSGQLVVRNTLENSQESFPVFLYSSTPGTLLLKDTALNSRGFVYQGISIGHIRQAALQYEKIFFLFLPDTPDQLHIAGQGLHMPVNAPPKKELPKIDPAIQPILPIQTVRHKKLWAALTAVMLFYSVNVFSSDKDISGIYDRIRKTASISADFEQLTYTIAVNRKTSATGSALFIFPGMSRWDYSTPEVQSIYADYEYIKFVDPILETVSIKKLQGNVSAAALLLLSGNAPKPEDFTVPDKPEKTPLSCKGRLIYLRPAGKDLIKEIHLCYRPQALFFDAVYILEHNGNYRIFNFANIRAVKPDIQKLTFDIPKGWESAAAQEFYGDAEHRGILNAGEEIIIFPENRRNNNLYLNRELLITAENGVIKSALKTLTGVVYVVNLTGEERPELNFHPFKPDTQSVKEEQVLITDGEGDSRNVYYLEESGAIKSMQVKFKSASGFKFLNNKSVFYVIKGSFADDNGGKYYLLNIYMADTASGNITTIKRDLRTADTRIKLEWKSGSERLMELSASQKKQLEAALLQMKKEVSDEITAGTEDLKYASHEGYSDPIDRAKSESEHVISLRIKDREKKLLSKISSALERLKNDEINICRECDEEIGFNRLMARPVTDLCISCKERQEQSEYNAKIT